MTKLNILALLGIVAALGMAGCGHKKSSARRDVQRGDTQLRDHRTNKKTSKKARKAAKRDMRREERNMFAK